MIVIKHKLFTFVAGCILALILSTVVLYDYTFVVNPTDLTLRFILKPIPVLLMVVITIAYMIIYRLHTYALLIQMSLLFSLMGDVLLMFYEPTIPEYDNILFLITGGASFFIGRCIMALAFLVYPFNNCKYNGTMRIGMKKTIITSLVVCILMAPSIVVFVIYMKGSVLMKVVLPIYILSMGLDLATATVRIGGYIDETLSSQVIALIGTIFFMISDYLLFWNLFLGLIPYGDVISITIYWLAMYLITISIVRTNSYEAEKLNEFTYLPLTVT